MTDTDVVAARRVFLTGATGYIGGRLAPRLLDAGWHVRCLARSPRKLDARTWRRDPRVEVVEGDINEMEALSKQMVGCDVAYYLVHSMIAKGGDYASHDRRMAETFAEAATKAGVRRIIYLGGLGELGEDLSKHLRSRREVESALASGSVPVTTLRAAMIIGAGSASFEIMRYLVERLPIMVTPRWVRTECQPIAVADVLYWLVETLRADETTGRVVEIGGPDVMDYEEIMRIVAEELKLPRRLIVPVPVLTPRLSSLWIGLVTPVTARIARPLAEGLRNRVVVTDDSGMRLMPHQALSVRESVRRAIGRTAASDIETRWSAAGVVPGDPDWAGGTPLTDAREILIDAPPSDVWRAVCKIGGGHGWYGGDILWRIRGWMDQLVGGPGLRRGRRHPEEVEYGEALDFWRVIGVDQPRSLELRAEMRLPGIAQLDFALDDAGESSTELHMTARFRPRGLTGLAYWYAVLPLHAIVFGGMLRGIKREAERMASETPSVEEDGAMPDEESRTRAPAQGQEPLKA